MKNIFRKWWFKWLLLGLAVRFLLMPFTVHPDLWGQTVTSYFFSYKGIVNIYDYILQVPQSSALAQNFSLQYIFIYPPLTYFTQGFLNLLVRPLLDPGFISFLIEKRSEILGFDGLYSQLFILKLPYLVVDIAAGYMLASTFKKKEKKIKAFALWMLNPLTIYATFMIGQNDILPVFFTITSLYFWKRKSYWLSLMMLGIGGSYKLYPLLLVPPAAFLASDRLIDRVKYVFYGAIPYIVTTLPFLSSKGYRSIVLANPESTKIIFMGLKVSGAEQVYVFVAILIFLYFWSLYQKKKYPLYYYFLAIILAMFSVTHFHPQWFLWATPFLAMILIEKRFNNWHVVALLLLSWLSITLLFEPSLSYGLFIPVFQELKNAVGLSEFIQRYYDPFVIKSLIRSVFAGSSLFLIYSMFTDEKTFRV